MSIHYNHMWFLNMLKISSATFSFLTFMCENAHKSLCVPAHVIKFESVA